MSAIFGVVRFDGKPVSRQEIERMGSVMANRGPDGRHVAVEGQAGLGHCLMRVNAEDLFERQPIRERDLTLVADIRLDNREALAELLAIGATGLRDMPDSALLLAAYRHWGEDCVEHLLGDFTFALWNHAKQTLLLARDHMGQRGLFYHRGEDFVAFATDVKALWAIDGVPRRLAEDVIGKRLLVPVDRTPGETLFEGIAVLPNATLLRLDSAGATARTYWEPRAGAEHLDRDEAYYLETYRRVVEEAIACRVRRLTRPPALCFSGGFDSGTIAVVAGRIAAEQGRKVVAVASVLDEGDRGPFVRDPRPAVEAFARHPAIDLHYYARGEDSSFDDLERSFEITHTTTGTPYVRQGLYRMAAAAGARLVMDGHGGDYTVNIRDDAALGRMIVRGRISSFLREFALRRKVTGLSAQRLFRREVLPALQPLRVLAFAEALKRGFSPQWRIRPIAEGFARSLFARGVIDPARLRNNNPVHHRWRARRLHFLRMQAAGAPAQTPLAAAHGLEFTRPFHDRRVVELGLALPESLHLKNGEDRHLARHVFGDALPVRLLKRGRGNTMEEPDHFRMAKDHAPAALEEARTLDRDGRLSRYVDFAKVDATITGADERRVADRQALSAARLAITTARFIAWFDRTN